MTYENPHPGEDYDIVGYRIDGEWYDVEGGDPYPPENRLHDIDLITLNLDPGHEFSDKGEYATFKTIGGFEAIESHDLVDDQGYSIDDLAAAAFDAYGFTT